MNARGLNRPIAAPSADGGFISAANRAAEVACLHASEPRTRRVQVFGQAPSATTCWMTSSRRPLNILAGGKIEDRSRRLLNRPKSGIIVDDSY